MQKSNLKNHVSAYKGWPPGQKQKHKKLSITKISSPLRNPLWVSKTVGGGIIYLFIYKKTCVDLAIASKGFLN